MRNPVPVLVMVATLSHAVHYESDPLAELRAIPLRYPPLLHVETSAVYAEPILAGVVAEVSGSASYVLSVEPARFGTKGGAVMFDMGLTVGR